MFRIKVCGITSVDDGRMAAEAGAEAVGLNFYARSKRHVTPKLAQQIAAAMPPEVVRVGVFVNEKVDTIRQLVDTVGLDMIQLHGDEPARFVTELAAGCSMPVIRAFRLGPDGAPPIVAYVQRCLAADCPIRMILIDAYSQGDYGGTGKKADWLAVRELPREGLPPLILAGGLTPENVALAIETTRPAAVDTAGGVESTPGRKDPRRVRAFVEAARAALGGDSP
ncbi:MAG: phosphoribosylanthranilate isomerase [Pirellulales bacterium]|nr:phosphoribosylanthranilate isomerase [Pirellulales bacterium]